MNNFLLQINIKKFQKKKRQVPVLETEGINDVLREVKIMEGVDSDYVVKTYGKFADGETLWVFSSFFIFQSFYFH